MDIPVWHLRHATEGRAKVLIIAMSSSEWGWVPFSYVSFMVLMHAGSLCSQMLLVTQMFLVLRNVRRSAVRKAALKKNPLQVVRSCFMSLFSKLQSVSDGETFPHSQQQSSVSRQPTWLERLAVVIVAALRVHADDVIAGETTTSVMQEIQSTVATCWKDRKNFWQRWRTLSHLCESR